MSRAGEPPRGNGLAGARFGVLVGSTAWAVLLGIVCAATGRCALLLPVVLPLLLASLGAALLVLVPIELLHRGPVADAGRVRVPLVLGGVGVLCGMLVLLAESTLAPVFAADPDLAAGIRSTGGVLALPRWLSGGMLLLGIAGLAVALRRIGR